MTRIEGDVLYIEPEEPLKCGTCGEIRGTRPVGPGGAPLCRPCYRKGSPALKAEAILRLQARILGIQPEDVPTARRIGLMPPPIIVVKK